MDETEEQLENWRTDETDTEDELDESTEDDVQINKIYIIIWIKKYHYKKTT